MNSKVSIIIPCYNGAQFLRAAIDSVLSQTYTQKELIVVNDGSTDSSLEIIKSYGKQLLLINQINKGLPAARNSGIASSSGSLFAFLDADDYWEPTFLEKMVAAINETGADIAYCGWQNIGLSGPCGEPYIPPDYQRMSNKIEKLLAEPGWPVHAAIIKKKTLFDEGIFNTTLKSGEDFDLWLRTALSNTIVLVPEVLSYYRHHENQMTSHRSLIALTHLAVQQEFLKNHQELVKRLGYKKIRELTIGGLLKKGYVCYWDRELFAAREIFCVVMKYGYGKLKDWKYMLPSILSYSLHAFLLRQIDS